MLLVQHSRMHPLFDRLKNRFPSTMREPIFSMDNIYICLALLFLLPDQTCRKLAGVPFDLCPGFLAISRLQEGENTDDNR